MAKQTFVVTKKGYDAYKEELENLIQVQRPDVQLKLKEARAQGDLSENAEYDAARDLQGRIEGRIRELTTIIDGAIVMEPSSNDEVFVGSIVSVHNMTNGRDLTYSIVGPTEAKILEKKISNESPLGQALLGKKKGDVVSIETMNGNQTSYQILDIKM